MSDMAADILSALLAEQGYDSFEQTETGVDAYIPTEQLAQTDVDSLLADFPLPDVKYSFQTEAMENKDWNEEWETNSFEPIVIPELCCIHDTRHEADSTVPYDIIINPRMAFGSGTHETTSQLVELLLRSDFHGQNVLDMGCGTCILGICMSLRGAERVVAIDIDEQSVDNSLLNCGLNHLNNIYVVHGDASAIRETFDTIIANIHRNIIINDLPTYVAHLRKGGTLIVSGFFTEDIPAIQAAAEAQGLTLVHQQERNNWTVTVFRK
ncbi:MAG: 50S ribosomal protein L11 methyltransferase [Bacteroidaceae bacterium]|nr:50S ribosomal protein L11 methyltransferase [Bacteroidaceae bacterium]